MFLRLLFKAVLRNPGRKLLGILIVALGAALTAAMLNLYLGVGERMAQELRGYGTNVVMSAKADTLPKTVSATDFNPIGVGALLPEEKLDDIMSIFWRNNIVGFTPYLFAPAQLDGGPQVTLVGTWFRQKVTAKDGESFTRGILSVRPWWRLKGRVPNDSQAGAIVGKHLAASRGLKVNSRLELTVEGKKLSIPVTAILSGSGQENSQVFVPIRLLQARLGLAGKISQIDVSTLTTPDNDLARKYRKDPDLLTSSEWEQWYCTAFVDAIAYQLEETIPGSQAKPFRQVAQSEGAVLDKIQGLMVALTAAALISSAIGVASLATTTVFERSKEIGLLKAIGAQNWAVVSLFLGESAITALAGGLFGYLLGAVLTQAVALVVFGRYFALNLMVLPAVLLLVLAITLLGSAFAVSSIARLTPKDVLHGV